MLHFGEVLKEEIYARNATVVGVVRRNARECIGRRWADDTPVNIRGGIGKRRADNIRPYRFYCGSPVVV